MPKLIALLACLAITASAAPSPDTALLEAIQGRDARAARAALDAGANPNLRDARGNTPLLLASGLGSQPIASLLLDRGADLHALDSAMGASALHRAAQVGAIETARTLLDRGGFLNLLSSANGHTPLLDSIFYRQPAMVDFLLSRGANTAPRNTLGLDAMDWAKRQNVPAMILALENHEAAEKEREARQVLMAAVRVQDLARVRAVLATKPLIDEVDRIGNTPLLWASRNGMTEIVQELLEAGANPNHVDQVMKATSGHKAAFFGHLPSLKLLAAHGLDLDAIGPYNGYTALHDSILQGHEETSLFLIQVGAKRYLRGWDGKDPLTLARMLGQTRVVEALLAP